jgi:hypothetical protein
LSAIRAGGVLSIAFDAYKRNHMLLARPSHPPKGYSARKLAQHVDAAPATAAAISEHAGSLESKRFPDSQGAMIFDDHRVEVLMRILVLAILAVGAGSGAAPAQAQTYDPNYPVCLQIYDDMVHYYFECRYTSIPQCQASASGRAAQCVVNPFYARTHAKPVHRRKRSHNH